MMTFKEFYLQSSKGDKAPHRALRSFKISKTAERHFGTDREAEGSQGLWRPLISTSTMRTNMSGFTRQPDIWPTSRYRR